MSSFEHEKNSKPLPPALSQFFFFSLVFTCRKKKEERKRQHFSSSSLKLIDANHVRCQGHRHPGQAAARGGGARRDGKEKERRGKMQTGFVDRGNSARGSVRSFTVDCEALDELASSISAHRSGGEIAALLGIAVSKIGRRTLSLHAREKKREKRSSGRRRRHPSNLDLLSFSPLPPFFLHRLKKTRTPFISRSSSSPERPSAATSPRPRTAGTSSCET